MNSVKLRAPFQGHLKGKNEES